MNLPDHYTGPVYFFYWPAFDAIILRDTDQEHTDYVLLGCVEVDVRFDLNKTVPAAVERLREAIVEERTNSAHRVAQLEQEIGKLLALDHKKED